MPSETAGFSSWDLAAIRVPGLHIEALVLRNSDDIRVGEHVIAIGTPRGLEATMSDGLISGKREVEGSQSILQTTAPISHGSSGGPLCVASSSLEVPNSCRRHHLWNFQRGTPENLPLIDCTGSNTRPLFRTASHSTFRMGSARWIHQIRVYYWF